VREILGKFKIQLLDSAFVRVPVIWAKKIRVPGFSGLNLFTILRLLIQSFKKNAYSIRSSAIAFKFFLALFPGILFLFSLIPYIPVENFQENLLLEIEAVTPPNIFGIVEQTINNIVGEKHGMVLGIGLVLALFYASNGINTMLMVFNNSFQIQLKRNPIRQRILALGIFSAMSLFMLIAILAITFGEIAIHNIEYKKLGALAHFVFQVVKWLVMVVSLIISVGILYNLGNPERKKWIWWSPGASLATVIIILASYGMAFFFTNFGQYNELYGSIGTLMMVMMWLNIVAYILILGFEMHTLSDAQFIEYED